MSFNIFSSIDKTLSSSNELLNRLKGQNSQYTTPHTTLHYTNSTSQSDHPAHVNISSVTPTPSISQQHSTNDNNSNVPISSSSISYTSLIHCFNNQQSLIEFAAKSVHSVCKTSDCCIQITSPVKEHDAFLSLFENNSDFTIFYDHDHAASPKNVLQSYCKRKDETLSAPKMTIQPLVMNPKVQPIMGQYGRTATWMAQYYNFPSVIAQGTKPIIAIISLGGGYQTSDLVQYWTQVCGLSTYPNVLNVPVGQTNVGVYTGSNTDIENALDLEIAGAVCPNSTLLFVSAPNTFLGFYQAFAAAINGVVVHGITYKPSVVSCSWGAPELYFSTAQLNAFNSLFAAGVNQGVTVTAAAGDNGSNDGYSYNNKPNVDFPASSPWVVACGGTTITATTETVWSYNTTTQWATGGGISSFFAQPTWQNQIVTLPNTTPSVSYLSGKRALPDISANADPQSGWTIAMGGKNYTNSIGGTSCVSPFIAGYLALLNFHYPISFTNQLYSIYRNPNLRSQCFRDVTVGTNDNIKKYSGVWNATPGWDNCTGLGCLNGNNLYLNFVNNGLLKQ
jgi:subtilase family serine protease